MQPVLTNINYISILLNKSRLDLGLAACNLMLDTSQRIIATEHITGINYLKIRLKVIPGKQCPGLDDDLYAFIGIQVPIYKKDNRELQEYRKACLKNMSEQEQLLASEEILALRGLFIAFRNLTITLKFMRKEDIFNVDTIYLACSSRDWKISIERGYK